MGFPNIGSHSLDLSVNVGRDDSLDRADLHAQISDSLFLLHHVDVIPGEVPGRALIDTSGFAPSILGEEPVTLGCVHLQAREVAKRLQYAHI